MDPSHDSWCESCSDKDPLLIHKRVTFKRVFVEQIAQSFEEFIEQMKNVSEGHKIVVMDEIYSSPNLTKEFLQVMDQQMNWVDLDYGGQGGSTVVKRCLHGENYIFYVDGVVWSNNFTDIDSECMNNFDFYLISTK